MPAFGILYVAKLAIVGAIVALLYFAARALRRVRFLRGHGQIAVLESAALSPQTALHLVRVGRRYFLIGSAAKVGLLAEFAPLEIGTDQTLK